MRVRQRECPFALSGAAALDLYNPADHLLLRPFSRIARRNSRPLRELVGGGRTQSREGVI